MKEEVINFAKFKSQEIIEDTALTPQQRLYQLSMPLLALATLKDNQNYEILLNQMHVIIKDKQAQIEKPWQLWMLGRMALASKLAGDVVTLTEIKQTLSQGCPI